MATPIKRGKKWRIQPSKTLRDGTKVRTSITADTKQEAIQLARIWEVDIEANDKHPSNFTVEDCLDKYRETCKAQKLSPSYIKLQKEKKSAYTSILKIQVRNLSLSDIQDHFNARAVTGVSPGTLKLEKTILKSALKPYAPHLNFESIKLPKSKKRKKKQFRSEWKHTVPEKIVEMYGKADMYIYGILTIHAGLRPSESYALTFGDLSKEPIIDKSDDGTEIKIGTIKIDKALVQDEDRTYTKKDPKTDAGYRTIEIAWELIDEILSIHPRGKDDEQIIKLKPQSVVKPWRDIRKALNLPNDIRFYDLRHFYATAKVLSGATEEELQSDMGHSKSSFTHEVYVEIMADHKEEANRIFVKDSSVAIQNLRKIEDKKVRQKDVDKGQK